MWGNLTGWIASLAVAAVLGGLLFYVAAPPSPTEPTNSKKLAVATKEIVLPISPDVVVTPGTKSCDAGEKYRKAIKDYQLTSDTYERFNKGGQMKIKEKDLSAIGDILAARDCKECNLFRTDPTKLVNYENTEPPVEALQDAGNIACTFGKLYTNEKYNPKLDPAKAFKLWEAAFVLGRHLYEERVAWSELVAGHGLMQTAGIDLHEYYLTYAKPPDKAKAAKIQEFLDAEGSYALKLTEAFQIVGTIDENYGGKYAGDIFQIARSATADPMFRVEAIKHIGHYRFNAQTMGDQMGARKVLRKLVDDANLPANVKAAANAAHDLTIEKHRMVGGAS
jgi:hypothetical protein